jgi:hypothetical protein
MEKPSWPAQVVVALLCLLVLVSCGPNAAKSDSGAPLVSIEVTPAESDMVLGETLQFKATGHYADNSTKDISTLVFWNVYAHRGVVNISQTGLLDANWVSRFLGGLADVSAAVTMNTNNVIVGWAYVRPASPVSIAVTPVDPIVAVGVGASLQFTATGTYRDGSTSDLTSYLHWSASDGTTAVFSSLGSTTGLATDLSVGSTTIMAREYDDSRPGIYGVSGSTTLTVIDATLVSIAITPVDPSMAAGSSLQFTATGTYSDGSTHDLTSSIIWSSANPGTATMSSAGLATAVAAGTTIISATAGTKSSTTTLTVTSGSGGTASTPIVSTGKMIKGGAIVNGIQFGDTLANITADDTPKSAAFLQSGMTVKIKGSRNADGLTGVADEIHVENDARGTILLKGVDSFQVLGQTVFVDGGTIFANVAGFASLLMGDYVEVYGLRNAAGSIRATRVERLSASGVDEVRGTIRAKDGSMSSAITIDSGMFLVDNSTTVLPPGTPFGVGTLVEIRLTGFHVDQLKVEDAFDAAFKPTEGGEFEVEGFITGFTGLASSFFVNGQAVNASGALLVGGLAADLNNDVKAEAEGHLIGAVLVADKIRIK